MSSLTKHSTAYFGTPNRPNEEAATIQAERAKTSFPIRSMTYLLDGGEEETKYKVCKSVKPIFHQLVSGNV